MTGGTRKRGSTWSYYFDLGKVGGKRQKKEKGGFKTRKEAALVKALSEYNHSDQVFTPAEITVSDFLDQWYELYCKPNLKYNSQVGYLQIMEKHIKPRFGPYKLKSINAATLQEYANGLKLNDYSKSHMSGILSVFQSALDYAVEPLHYITTNPMKLVKYPKVERKPRERIILTMDEWQQIITRFKNTRFYIPLIVEQKGKREQRSSWYFSTPKTSSSVRTIPFGAPLYNALKAEQTSQKKNELKYGEFYTIHVLRKETDEKGNDMQRIISVQKCAESQLQRVRLVCIAENGQYTSTNSFKYCSRVIPQGNAACL